MKTTFLFRLILIVAIGMIVFLPVLRTYSQASMAGSATGISWNPDGSLLAVSGNFGIAFYDADFQFDRTLTTEFIRALAWSPEGELLAASSKLVDTYIVSLWDVRSNQLKASIATPITRAILSLVWSPDSRFLAVVTYEQGIYIYEVATVTLVFTLTEGASVIESAAWSPDGNYIAASGGGYITDPDTPAMITVWRADTGAVEFSIDASETEGIRRISRIAFSPDNSTIMLGTGLSSQGSVSRLDMASRTIAGAYIEPLEPITFMGWSPDGTRFALTDEGGTESALFIWDAITGERILLQRLTDFEHLGYWDGAWKPDSSQIAMLIRDSNARRTIIRILDAKTGNEVAELALPDATPITPTPESTPSSFNLNSGGT